MPEHFALLRARELAQSGQFQDVVAVQIHMLLAEGLPEAQLVLDDPANRADIEKICAESRAAQGW